MFLCFILDTLRGKKNELIRILVSDDTNSPCLLCTYYRVTFRELLRAWPLLQELFREAGRGEQGDGKSMPMDLSGYNGADTQAGSESAALVQIWPLSLAGWVTGLGK